MSMPCEQEFGWTHLSSNWLTPTVPRLTNVPGIIGGSWKVHKRKAPKAVTSLGQMQERSMVEKSPKFR